MPNIACQYKSVWGGWEQGYVRTQFCYWDYYNDWREAGTKVDVLQGEVNTLTTRLSTATSGIGALQTELNQKQGELNTAIGSLNDLEPRVAANEAKIAQEQQQQLDLQTKVTDMQAQVDAGEITQDQADSNIAALQAEQAQQGSDIGDLQSRADALQARVDAGEITQEEAQRQFDILQQQQLDLQTQVTDDIEGFRSETNDILARVEAGEISQEEAQLQFDELQTQVTDLQSRVESGEISQAQADSDIAALKEAEAERVAVEEARVVQEQEQEQFIIDNNLSPEHFSLTPEEQERDLFISQSQQFLDLEGAKADLLTQKNLSDALEADTNATQEEKDAQRSILNTSLSGLIMAGLAIGVPIGQILSSDDVTGAVENQPEDVGLQFRQQTPDLEISPTLGPSFSNTAGLLGGGGGFTTRPSTSPKFQELPIPKAPKPTFNQFEDNFNPNVTATGFPKPKNILNTGNSLGLLGRT